jgi:hypothetical protein
MKPAESLGVLRFRSTPVNEDADDQDRSSKMMPTNCQASCENKSRIDPESNHLDAKDYEFVISSL